MTLAEHWQKTRGGVSQVPGDGTGLSKNQMQMIVGGTFPYARGFRWECVEHFELEAGVWQPYAGEEILPAPGIVLSHRLEEGFFEAAEAAGK